MTSSLDRLLLESRDYSLRIEQAAAQDLTDNLDAYLPPSWTVRKMAKGYADYAKNEIITDDTYKLFRYAFSETKGASHRVFSDVIADVVPKISHDLTKSMFVGTIDLENTIKSGLYSLNHFGYYKLKVLAPDDLVARLRSEILEGLRRDAGAELDAAIAGDEGAPMQLKGKHGWLATCEDLYRLAADPLPLSIAQEYLGVPPIFNTPVAFLNSAREVKSERELSDTAQLYHHDLHRLKFVKLFIYLTDVDADSGPHALVEGTHRFRPSEALWADGRHLDEAIAEANLGARERTITGPAGTVFLVDTSALHKGTHPTARHRIMAQVQYTNSLFGRPWPESERKVLYSSKSKNKDLQIAADHARKYAQQAGVRFMQNYI